MYIKMLENRYRFEIDKDESTYTNDACGLGGGNSLDIILHLEVGSSNRLLLILSTQLTAVLLIAVDSGWNWKAILAGLFVVTGAVLGAYAIE